MNISKHTYKELCTVDFNLYMNDILTQAREDMVKSGYEELTTPEDVDTALNREGTTLVMVNSVCGCAGGIARPAAAHAIHYDKRPDHLVTVFAGQDKEATAKARSYFTDYPPSSPSFALLKDGKILTMVERHEIEGHDPMSVVNKLQRYFDEYCEEV
ncbi:BrxA/BrxB family bacilliredoxin [Lederbergia graminis]|uniref:BrxA/BrxB family bacilliredoxin n=1 Tax=Lederbergia graminis TaxID=735518 RepID=A0ABW0LE43_9BACI|nr:BrxA/BrxB family bacilliredoxin [Paenibacillus bovis]HLU23458.1 BrxA/BrxB family bacilliredoxin [Bacillaceae bacterium]